MKAPREITGDEQVVPEETVSGDGISNDTAPVTDQGTVEGDEEDGIPTDGWYTDENGNTYYYENGEKLQEVIVEIEGRRWFHLWILFQRRRCDGCIGNYLDFLLR